MLCVVPATKYRDPNICMCATAWCYAALKHLWHLQPNFCMRARQLITVTYIFTLFGWLWLVVDADLLWEKNTASWLALVWCERKTLLAGCSRTECLHLVVLNLQVGFTSCYASVLVQPLLTHKCTQNNTHLPRCCKGVLVKSIYG